MALASSLRLSSRLQPFAFGFQLREQHANGVHGFLEVAPDPAWSRTVTP
jgi:hypothetical protein